MPEKLPIAAFFSGGASTLEAIIREIYVEANPLQVDVRVAITNNPYAGGITRIQPKDPTLPGIPVFVVNRNMFKSREEYVARLISILKHFDCKVFGQYGYLPLMPLEVIEYADFGINQHNAPIDPSAHDFGGKGMYGVRTVFARILFCRLAGETRPVTEVTSQLVAYELDNGKVLKRHPISIEPDDTPESLGRRMLTEEHYVQIRTLADVVSNGGKPKVAYTDYHIVSNNKWALLEFVKTVTAAYYSKDPEKQLSSEMKAFVDSIVYPKDI